MAAAFTWTSSNVVVGTINVYGTFIAGTAGSTTITASSGGRSGTASVTVIGGGKVLITVIDSRTRRPVSYATVRLNGDSERTNGSGIAEFERVPSGTYTVSVTKSNFRPSTATITVTGDMRATVLLTPLTGESHDDDDDD